MTTTENLEAMSKANLTFRAVKNQLHGMRAARYEVGLLNQDGKMSPRLWTPDQVLKSVPWLKQQNAIGCHIYIRPEGSQGLILVDDLTLGAISEMKRDGFAPAVEVETSPFNFQAWVRVSNMPISKEIATTVAVILAERYDGDRNSADWRHYGRLGGFTNRKPEYCDGNGRFPYVKVHVHSGRIAVNAENLLVQAKERFQAAQKAGERSRRSRVNFEGNLVTSAPKDDPVMFYRRHLALVSSQYGRDMDVSRADWMTAKRMAVAGYKPGDIENAIHEASPGLDERKKGHIEDYVSRTVRNVMLEPDVIKSRQGGPKP